MVSENNNIRELNYKIRRVELDIKNLERTIETKRRNRLLDADVELALKNQIDAKKGDIAFLQAEIRRIENEAVRSQNVEEGIDLKQPKRGLSSIFKGF